MRFVLRYSIKFTVSLQSSQQQSGISCGLNLTFFNELYTAIPLCCWVWVLLIMWCISVICYTHEDSIHKAWALQKLSWEKEGWELGGSPYLNSKYIRVSSWAVNTINLPLTHAASGVNVAHRFMWFVYFACVNKYTNDLCIVYDKCFRSKLFDFPWNARFAHKFHKLREMCSFSVTCGASMKGAI